MTRTAIGSRGPRTRALVAVAVLVTLTFAVSARASGDGPVGGNPKHNDPLDYATIPSACDRAPDGPTCIDAAIRYIDGGRASLHQSRYRLPRNFVSLTPDEQDLVLTDLDRGLYHLSPITGLTDALGADAAAGVRHNGDPQPASFADLAGFTANWAAGMPNIVYAYGVWMYDDGPGSDNLDCTPSHPSGCWGHRHDVLWSFGSVPGPLAMGADAGRSTYGPAFAMLIVKGTSGYHPRYTYTWSSALREGAG